MHGEWVGGCRGVGEDYIRGTAPEFLGAVNVFVLGYVISLSTFALQECH